MHFAKMQGVGNDFVVVALQENSTAHLPALAEKLCQRHFSVGADGLLVIGHASTDSAFTFRMFNPDGSEDMCGNGLRCAALWAYQQGLVKLEEFTVDTKDGSRACELMSVDGNTAVVRVDMGQPHFESASLPMITDQPDFISRPIQILDRVFTSTVINTGSTHSILFEDMLPEDDVFFKYSPIFENNSKFPERTSVIWTEQAAPGRFYIRIWERGAGETLGCGTGACAAAVAAIVNDKAGRTDNIVISSKGGDLTINWSDTVWMTGPAVLVFNGLV